MEELQSAIRYVAILVSTVVALVLGDYLGYKVGRKRLALVCLGVGLLAIVVFAVYAAVVLLA